MKWGGKEFTVACEEDETVSTLKHKLEQETKVLSKRQKVSLSLAHSACVGSITRHVAGRSCATSHAQPRPNQPLHANSTNRSEGRMHLRSSAQLLGLKTKDGKAATDDSTVGQLQLKAKIMMLG